MISITLFIHNIIYILITKIQINHLLKDLFLEILYFYILILFKIVRIMYFIQKILNYGQ